MCFPHYTTVISFVEKGATKSAKRSLAVQSCRTVQPAEQNCVFVICVVLLLIVLFLLLIVLFCC